MNMHSEGALLRPVRDLQEAVRNAYGELFRSAGPRRKLSMVLEPARARRAIHSTRLSRPDWSRVDRLVFTCMGNICRSAYANAVMVSHGIPTASFGFSTEDGRPANADAISHAQERGYDLSGHATLAAGSMDVRASDCLLLMDIRHVDAARELCSSTGAQFYPLGFYLDPPVRSIPDPYAGSRELFRFAFAMIDLGAAILIQELTKDGQLTRLRAGAG